MTQVTPSNPEIIYTDFRNHASPQNLSGAVALHTPAKAVFTTGANINYNGDYYSPDDLLYFATSL